MDSSYSDTGARHSRRSRFFFLIAVAFYVISSWFLMKIFDKAGVQGRWRAWVPVYNLLVFAKLGDLSPWVMLIAIACRPLLSGIPVLGVVIGLVPVAAGAMAAWRVGQKLQKETPWVILYIFLSLIWLGINAFDKSRWNPNIAPAPWASNGFFADRTCGRASRCSRPRPRPRPPVTSLRPATSRLLRPRATRRLPPRPPISLRRPRPRRP
jgi:hypothetical protein